jgi:hypothetical protein
MGRRFMPKGYMAVEDVPRPPDKPAMTADEQVRLKKAIRHARPPSAEGQIWCWSRRPHQALTTRRAFLSRATMDPKPQRQCHPPAACLSRGRGLRGCDVSDALAAALVAIKSLSRMPGGGGVAAFDRMAYKLWRNELAERVTLQRRRFAPTGFHC